MTWSFKAEMPIYTQLVDQIKRAIAAGAMAPGQRMASVRDLALEAGVNPNTVQRAFQQLEHEGLVYAQRGNGRYVTEDVTVIGEVRKALALEQARQFRAAMEALGCSDGEIKKLLFGSEEEDNGKLSGM